MPEQRQVYVGHRYVPKVMGEWTNLISYEGLSIVLNEGNSFTSKKMVPIGVQLSNEEYWAPTGNYNAQLENYRNEVKLIKEDVELFDENLLLLKNDTSDKLNKTNNQINEMALNIKSFGAKGETGFDNSIFIKNAISALPIGGTLLIPNEVFEINSEIIFNKPINLIMYGTFKFTGSGTAVTLSCVDSSIKGLHVIRDFGKVNSMETELLHTGVRFRGVKKTNIYNPVVEGFSNGLLFDNENGFSNAYIEIYSQKIKDCKISINRPEVSGSGWTNEVNFFGGGVELNPTFSDFTGSKYINLEGGDCFRFYAVSLESDHVERKVYSNAQSCLWNGCRFEGSNGVLDIEIDGARNEFISGDRIWWQSIIVDRGEDNLFNNPKQNSTTMSNRNYYVDFVNGNNTNNGLSTDKPIKTITRLLNLLPRKIDHDVVVYLKEGTFNEPITLNNLQGKGSLTIQGTTNEASNHTISFLSVVGCQLGGGITIKNITAITYSVLSKYSAFYISNTNVTLTNIKSDTITSIGLLSDNGASVNVTNPLLSNKNTAVHAQFNGKIYIISGAGSSNVVGLNAITGGIISKGNATMPTATTPEKVANGGTIIGHLGSIS